MTRALLWKEFRQQRGVVLAAWVIALVLPVFLVVGMQTLRPGQQLRGLGGVMPVALLLFVWPVIAVAAGAVTVSSDLSDESLRFLLSRPVSRRRVWAVKVGAALAAFLLAVLGSAAIAFAFDQFIGGPTANYFWRELDNPVSYSVAIPLLFLFVSAHYCSLFIRRPLAAAITGAVVAAAMGGGIFYAWLLYSRLPLGVEIPSASPAYRVQAMFFVVGTLVAGVLGIAGLMVAAYQVFRRCEPDADHSLRRMVQPLLIVTVVVIFLGSLPASYAGMRSMAEVAAERVGDLRAVDGGLVLPQLTDDHRSTALVSYSLDGAASSVVVPRDATLPARSPDGQWIAYVSYEIAMRPTVAGAHLRAVRPDGSDDHAISGELPGWHWNFNGMVIGVASDNDRVVFSSGRGPALLASISGGPDVAREVDLSGDLHLAGESGSLTGWAGGEDVELLYSVVVGRYQWVERQPRGAPGGTDIEWGDSLYKTLLMAFSADTGEVRVVAAFDGRHVLRISQIGDASGGYTARRWDRLPVWIDAGLLLVDTRSGEILRVTDAPCDFWGFSADGNRFLYGECSGTLRDDTLRAELRLRDLDSGVDEPFAVLRSYDPSFRGREVLLSADDARALFHARHGYGDYGTFVVERGGEPRPLAGEFVPLTWRDGGEALVARGFRYLTFAIIDVDTGLRKVVFP